MTRSQTISHMGETSSIQSIYTDGACSGNPGPGGWAVVIYFNDGSIHEFGGAEPQTTNNRMELQAAISALEFLTNSHYTTSVDLYTDSEYVKNGITKWIKGWKQKGWKTAAGKPVLNQDLWQCLDAFNRPNIRWQYVRGHSGNTGNERCDAIARAYCKGSTPSLQQITAASRATLLSEAMELQEISTPLQPELVQSNRIEAPHPTAQGPHSAMTDLSFDTPDDLPRDVKIVQLRHVVETLHMADDIAEKGYLITSSELADLMDINASAVTSRGDNWVWRNWVVSRVRREGNQILWQLERID